MVAHVGCSVLSSDEEACCLLAGCAAFPAAALTILKKYPGRQDIVVRITYCLGKVWKCRYTGTVLLKIGEFCNGCVTKRCLHNSRKVL
jgi:hypothetical protein